MRKLLFLLLLLLLAACGSAAAPEATVAPLAPPTDAPAVESETDEPPVGDSSQAAKNDVVTGSTPQEAGVVRPQDHTKGASDPLVTIVEYGDFQ